MICFIMGSMPYDFGWNAYGTFHTKSQEHASYNKLLLKINCTPDTAPLSVHNHRTGC